jgi:hypothetical protein
VGIKLPFLLENLLDLRFKVGGDDVEKNSLSFGRTGKECSVEFCQGQYSLEQKIQAIAKSVRSEPDSRKKKEISWFSSFSLPQFRLNASSLWNLLYFTPKRKS